MKLYSSVLMFLFCFSLSAQFDNTTKKVDFEPIDRVVSDKTFKNRDCSILVKGVYRTAIHTDADNKQKFHKKYKLFCNKPTTSYV